MSPTVPAQAERVERFPRVSGDEPVVMAVCAILTLFSPRERG